MRRRIYFGVGAGFLALAITGFAGREWFQTGVAATASLPTTVVKRGEVTFTVTAKGELQGGNSEMLSAPMTGGGPGTATTLLSFHIWKESFSMYDFGAGAAVACRSRDDGRHQPRAAPGGPARRGCCCGR